MASRNFVVQGVVIGRTDFGESDKIIDLMTEDQGKIRGLAKGVRKIKSRRLGSLELSNLIKALFYRGKTFDIITEVENLDFDLDFRRDETKLGTMMYVCELTSHLVPEGEENNQVYHRLLRARKDIKNGQWGKIVEFEADILQILGYGLKLTTKNLIAEKNYRRAHLELKSRIEDVIEHKLTSLEIFK